MYLILNKCVSSSTRVILWHILVDFGTFLARYSSLMAMFWRGNTAFRGTPSRLCKEVSCFQWFADDMAPQIFPTKGFTRRFASAKDLQGWSLELRLVTPLPEAVSSPIMEKREK